MAAISRPMKATVHIKHVAWRGGRPRFAPGPGLRAEGWRGEDIKNAAGAWASISETEDFMVRRLAEIAARRTSGAPAPRPARRALYTIEDMFEDWFASRRMTPERGPQAQRVAGRVAPATLIDYRRKAAALAASDPEFFTSPCAAVRKAHVLGLHEALWRARGLPMANGIIAVLRAAWSHAEARGKVASNPCMQLRLPGLEARLRIASAEEISALLAAADDPAFRDTGIGDAILLALYTGQRQADVLQLEARNEDAGHIRFIQAKTGARVRVRAIAQLRVRLAAIAARHATQPPPPGETRVVLNQRTGRSYQSGNFSHGYTAVRRRAAAACPSVATLRFQDLRDTSVTRLATAGCTIPEIAAISGHSLASVHNVLKHYLELNDMQADAAIDKLAAWMDREGIEA